MHDSAIKAGGELEQIVSAGSRLHPDDGAIPRVQVAFPECG